MGPGRSGSPEVTPAARLGASAGCSRATDRSEERQRVNRKCGSGSSSAARHQRPDASIAVRVRQPENIGAHIFTIGVMNEAWCWPTAVQCYLPCVDRQLGAQMIGERPAPRRVQLIRALLAPVVAVDPAGRDAMVSELKAAQRGYLALIFAEQRLDQRGGIQCSLK